MAIMAAFKDGKFVTNTASTESLSQEKKENSSGISSDTFLSLLVAEMKNQDPLEPTNNTEWVSQYAQFTQVSEVQAIGEAMNSMKAKDLVGEYAILKVTGENGNTDYISGKVDYVTYENEKAFLSINGSLYSIDDLDTVASEEYMEAYELASNVAEMLKSLPSVDNLTSSYKETVDAIDEKTSNMTDYQKTFLDKSVFDKINEYLAKMKNITE
ncbi:MAG TPA: flagellar hook capping protein [Lachnospiraceae bacterium]|nr:flagellar hook capping protein [Lachnospiraceae bacterium]